MLQVAMGGEVISSSVVFEYKARDLPALPSSQHDWLSLDGEGIYLYVLCHIVCWYLNTKITQYNCVIVCNHYSRAKICFKYSFLENVCVRPCC